MKQILRLVLLCTMANCWLAGCDQKGVHPLPSGGTGGLVPAPVSVVLPAEATSHRGFRCDGRLTISWPEGWSVSAMTGWLDRAGIEWERTALEDADWLWIESADSLGDEGYVLEVLEDRVRIEAGDEEAAFRGWTTLRQLMPPVCEQNCQTGFTLPAVRIEDHAFLAHRGLLLDCCRHFMAPDFVKTIIDVLALQKMNVLHWHLTEDQGWRLPIEAYPKLTEEGGFRTEANGQTTGGFYTRQDIEEILEYAAERHVEIIPEIEMPGHCRAALAAYPWLGCTGDSLPVPSNWGVFKDVYCAGSDSTMAFLKAVLDEVCELFPSEVIHIGGDEVPKVRWAECPKCQAKMKRLGLNNEAELQTAFINEIGAHVARRGKRIMGWDEILEGGLPEGAMVQSWRGMEGAIEATHLGTDAVVSPTSHCYLDYPLRSTDLKEVYAFQPVPEEAMGHSGQIVGGECNMWTERAPQELVMAKVLPRATGLAEVLWSGPEITSIEGSYDRFLGRLDGLGQRWAFMEVKPGLEGVPVSVDVRPGRRGEVDVLVQPALRNVGGMVHFQPAPDSESQPGDTVRVGQSVAIRGRGTVHVDVVLRGRPTGVTESFPVAGHQGAHQPVTLSYEPSPSYTGGGPQALADGRRGSLDFRDGAWQAAQGQDMACTIDLGQNTPIHALETQLYLYQDAWIFLPEVVQWSVSNDGKRFVDLPSQAPWGDALSPDSRQTVVRARMEDLNLNARFVRMVLQNPGDCPGWHDAATEPTWLFVDELVVESHP